MAQGTSRPFVPEDLYRIRQVTDVALHPDGLRAVYVVSWCDEATDANRSEIWLAPEPAGAAASPSAAGDGHRLLTRAHSAHSPRFSPDGRSLAYLAAGVREPAQLHVLALDGGEPAALGPFDDGCSSPVWLPDSSALVVVAALRPVEERGLTREELAERPRPRRITSMGYRSNGRGWIHDRADQLFLVDLEGSAPVQLTEGPWPVAEPAVSPDGRTVVVTSAREADQEWLGGRDLWMVDLSGALDSDSTSIRRHSERDSDSTDSDSTSSDSTSSDSTSIRRLTDGQGSWELSRFVGDGSQLLVIGHETRGDAGLAVPWLLDLDGGRPRRLGDGETSVHGTSVGTSAMSVLDDAVVLPGAHRGRVRLDRYPLDGSSPTTLAADPPMIGAFALDRAGRRLVYAASSPTRPAELFELEVTDGSRPSSGPPPAPRPCTNLSHELLAEVAFADYEEIEVEATDGQPVHGVVVRPPPTVEADRSEPRPGLLYVHGGPLAQYGLGFFDEFQAAAATGHVLVAGNPRGSDGYGQAHARAIAGGGLGHLDWLDVEALADHLAGLDDVDPARLGIGGGSYGGFMTTWAIAHTDRFAAALSERAVNNWETLEATSDIGAYFTRVYTGVTNLDDVEAQRRQSPISYAGNIRTPTLIVHSEADWRCPVEQAEQLFAALRRQGVACELVRFPGENHELTRAGRPSLRVARLRIVHEWWSRWLGAADFPPP